MTNLRIGCLNHYAEFSNIKNDNHLNSVKINRETTKKNSRYLSTEDVVLFSLEKNCEIIIRPSGIEPKLKCYLTVKSIDDYTAIRTLKALEIDLIDKIKLFLGQ